METLWFIFLAWSSALCTGFDLGPIVRTAQCRSQCLKQHTVNGSCDTVWETEYQQAQSCGICPACQTACNYRKTRIEEKYLPTMLPAPEKAPVVLERFDVAVMMRNVRDQWRIVGYFPGERAPDLRQDTWIIVATEDGITHYSWQEWVPKLESLKKGFFYEATISWKDVDTQIRRQKSLAEARANDRLRQVFLESYGEKVLAEWKSQEFIRMSKEIFRRFFFGNGKNDFEVNNALPKVYNDRIREETSRESKKESYVVSWQPQTGGLKGNQVTDSNSAQISLLPGTKYLVRIASSNGPGSFPIEVDTRLNSEETTNMQRTVQRLFVWEICVALMSILFFAAIFALAILYGKTKTAQCERV
ncbi:hypothetical protein WN51_12837 [Melipona quadrifasciata]|uniref:Fibronectin type-III domain-containing protein n=1 Tax=Melipona quadrifasciata TaxID=166423 RepID=A0A0M9A1P6_9HYME|nr:hypothetical protein WN51_12837 [Melipona quadrifasciata]